VAFNASASTGASALSYVWDFGDGSTATTATPATKIYNGAGSFKATVTVRDAAGLTSSAQSIITVTAPPSTNFVFASSLRIAGLLVRKNRPEGFARVTVTVKSSTGAVVPNATVKGDWSGIVTGKVSGVTNAQGQIRLDSPITPQVGTFTFKLASISAPNLTYDASRNVMQGISINF
jgi:PKD repeat protein